MPRNETGEPCYALFMCEDGIGIEVGSRNQKDFISFTTSREDRDCDPEDPPLAVIARFPQSVEISLTRADLEILTDILSSYLEAT